jgi:hypothetical protein
VGDADGREVEDRAEVEGESRAAVVVSARAVDEEHVGRVLQCAHCGFQEWAFAEA